MSVEDLLQSHTVTFQSRTTAASSMGSPEGVYADVSALTNLKCRVVEQGASSSSPFGPTPMQSRTGVIRFAGAPAITHDMRITWGSRTLYVEGVTTTDDADGVTCYTTVRWREATGNA